MCYYFDVFHSDLVPFSLYISTYNFIFYFAILQDFALSLINFLETYLISVIFFNCSEKVEEHANSSPFLNQNQNLFIHFSNFIFLANLLMKEEVEFKQSLAAK